MIDGYEFTIKWEPADVFVARATEFPSLAEHEDTREHAMAELRSMLSMVMEDVKDSGKSTPKPLETDSEQQ